MTVEFKYFVKDDFDAHYSEIFSMCTQTLGVAIEDLIYERTPAPLGEGENGFIIFLASKKPVKSVTYDKMNALREALEKDYGGLEIWVTSVCPVCEKELYKHLGYIGGELDELFRSDQCDKCFSKTYKKRKRQKKTKCFVCNKTFSMDEKRCGFRLTLYSHIYDELNQKRVAHINYEEGKFDTPQFCSIQCVRTKLDELIKELTAISNNLE